MLTAHFIVQPGIEITLPTAKAVEPQEVGDIIISITEGNEIFLNDKWIDISELKYSLEEKLKLSSKKTVILRADEKIDLGLAVKVMDIAKQANVDNLIISTKVEHQSTRAPEHQ
jgi:biopolymer transport protein ExbD